MYRHKEETDRVQLTSANIPFPVPLKLVVDSVMVYLHSLRSTRYLDIFVIYTPVTLTC